MASWEQALIEAMTRVAGGENPIQNIDHEAKVIEIKRDARIEPSILRRIEQAVEELGIGYSVEQLTKQASARLVPPLINSNITRALRSGVNLRRTIILLLSSWAS